MSAPPVSRTASFRVGAPCARLFPLFTPLGERAWVQGWNPEMLSGDTERGSVFRTRHGDGTVTTWIVSDYDPAAGRVAYARIAEGSNMGLVDVRCSAQGGGTSVSVTYTLTPLTADGQRFIDTFLSKATYAAMIAEWERAVRAALDSPSKG